MSLPIVRERIRSIDVLRGFIMVIMALDHVRDFFHFDALANDPLNPQTTTPALYFTRWVTHLCAPLFVLLSGTSAYLVGSKKSKSQLSSFLIKRGLWLIVAEVVIVSFALTFDPTYSAIFLQVIWAIGICMVLLGLLVWLPFYAILAIGLIIFFGHNALDAFEQLRNGQVGIFWSLLHRPGFFPLGDNRLLAVLYPFLPWLGVMILGYCLGKWFEPHITPAMRSRRLVILGLALIALFFVLRTINDYGNPIPRLTDASGWTAFFSFMNVQKYPPSLMFCSITIGIGLLLLAFFEQIRNRATDVLNVYGRVPFFYFMVHFYLIHFLCMIAFFLEGRGTDTIRTASSPFLFRPADFGYRLWIVYIIWIGLVLLMYPLCKWYNRYKSTHRSWWLSYI
jgi:uncharacterized membrane protein